MTTKIGAKDTMKMNKNGMTLVELMVCLTIIVIIVIITIPHLIKMSEDRTEIEIYLKTNHPDIELTSSFISHVLEIQKNNNISIEEAIQISVNGIDSTTTTSKNNTINGQVVGKYNLSYPNSQEYEDGYLDKYFLYLQTTNNSDITHIEVNKIEFEKHQIGDKYPKTPE